MPDPRFYHERPPAPLGDVARICAAELLDQAAQTRLIVAVAPLGRAGSSEVSYIVDRRFLGELALTQAAACFVTQALAENLPPGCTALISPEPQAAYARAANYLHHPRTHDRDAPAVHPDAVLEADVRLGHGVVIGPGAKIGRGTEIGANAVVGPGVTIGRDCVIGANTSIAFALIGDRVRLHPGAVIGAAGFGVAASAAGAVDSPQLGRVILQDGVTVGACSCIDRGAWDDTVVGENTKIDNLVQIAHNVRIGRNCVLAAQVGIAGSVVIGDGVQFGGKVGIGDHLTIGDRVRMAAGALAMKDIPAGETWCGIPAKPIRQFLREVAWLARKAETRGEGGRP